VRLDDLIADLPSDRELISVCAMGKSPGHRDGSQHRHIVIVRKLAWPVYLTQNEEWSISQNLHIDAGTGMMMLIGDAAGQLAEERRR